MNINITQQSRLVIYLVILAFIGFFLSCSKKSDLNPDEPTVYRWERTLERLPLTKDPVTGAPMLDLNSNGKVVVKQDTVWFTNKQVIDEKELVKKESHGMMEVTFKRLD